MARSFSGSSQYLEGSSAPVTAVPLTMACWFRSASVAATQVVMSLGNATGSGGWMIVANGGVGGDPLQAITYTASSSIASTTSGYSADTWHHGCAVFASATSRAAYLDGGNKGTNATNHLPSGVNRSFVGTRILSGTRAFFLNGMVAEAGIWDIALSDAEVAALATGLSPLLVRPESLVAYWPLWGSSDPEIDRVGGLGLAVTGATADAHPRVFNPPSGKIFLPQQVKIPVFIHHYRQQGFM